jgi:signal recognition particle receptor subunit beta
VSQYNKIIFTGPVGAGKTTAISVLSDTPPVSTDARASDMTKDRKSATTVALDYGVMTLSDGEKIHLYGTPGQERFDFMWDILTQGGIGLVLLMDNTRADPFSDLRFFIGKFRDFISQTNLVIGVTQMDMSPRPDLEEYVSQVGELGLKPPIFEVDARNRQDVSILVQALLYSINPSIDEAP